MSRVYFQDGTIRIQIPKPQIFANFYTLSDLENIFGISNIIAQHPYSPLEIVYQGEKQTRQLIFVAPDLSDVIHDAPHGVWVNIPTSDAILSLAISCPPAKMQETEELVLEEIPTMWTGELANMVDWGCWVIGPIASVATGVPLVSPFASLLGNQVKKVVDKQIPRPIRTTKREIQEKIVKMITKRAERLKANAVGGLSLNSSGNEALIMGVKLDKYPITITLPEDTSLYISGSLNDNALLTCQSLSSHWKGEKAMVVTHSPASGTVMVHSQGKQHSQDIPHRLRGVSTYRFVDLSSVHIETPGS